MAVTTTYTYPVAGATPPTAAEAATRVSAGVIASIDADTTATVTHNFGLSVAELAEGAPLVAITPLLQAEALLSGWAVTAKATDSITLTKSVTVGSGAAGTQIQVEVLRPHSIIG